MIISTLLVPIAHAADAASSSGNPVAVLGLNVQLFIAQLINFGVILFILWKWVFTPVAKKLQERSDKIQKSMNDSERIAKEKQEFEIWKNKEMGETRKQAGEIITQSQLEAGKLKNQLLAETKTQQVQLVEQAKQQILQEKDMALQSAKSELADIVTEAAEKILRHKLDSAKDKELIKESLANVK